MKKEQGKALELCSMSPKVLDRLIYIDDSGHSQSGLVVYGWVEFHPDRWSDVLGSWLKHRKQLWNNYSVPVTKELHMTSYALGRGRISTAMPAEFKKPDGTELWKDLGGRVAQKSLETMCSTEGLRVGAVYRQGTQESWARNRAEIYANLIDRFEKEMEKTNSIAMVFMDGDGSDTAYRDAHRNLPRQKRRIIEDPIYTDSKTSQLMQMADHVAWCANASIARIPKHEFAHKWYEDYLAIRDPYRTPQEI